MKKKLLICLIGVLGVRGALAIKGVTDPAVIDAIQKQIVAARLLDAEIWLAEQDVRIAKSKGAGAAKILEFERVVIREKDKQSAAYTKAIHLTLTAYDLWPESRRGTSVMPWTKDQTVHWVPIGRGPESREVRNKKGDEKAVKQPSTGKTGITYSDGVSHILPKAFENGPAYLASVLLHERTHFEQMTTPGKGDQMTKAKSEAEAYKSEVDNSIHFFDPVRDRDTVNAINSEWLVEEETAQREDAERKTLRGKIKGFFTPPTQPDFFERAPHRPEELESIKREFDDLGAIVAAELENARREREKLEGDRAASLGRMEADWRPELGTIEADRTPDLGRMEADTPPTAAMDLARLAAKACADPSGVTPAEADAISWYAKYSLGPLTYILENLHGCPRELLGELARMAGGGSPLNVEWLRREAARINERLSPPSSPDAADDSRPDRDRPGNRVGEGSSPARDQAGRIGGSGRWPR